MCGIFGLYYRDRSRTVEERRVIAATDTMMHRGPDDSGYYMKGNVGLGHRRLSIIDLSRGHQPMFNEDGRIALVYNGEIYNYKEIQEQLLGRGHVFTTDCDTEVIIHAYEEWGTKSVEKYIGMFVFCLWDGRTDSLWIVRDRLGIKPLYYYSDSEKFICASEVKALLKAGVVGELNEAVLDSYFSLGYVPGKETMFKHIKKLEPGHFMQVDESGPKEREYWDFSGIEKRDITYESACLQFDELLQDSVNKRLLSDVPLGVFLSGGIDSSVVTALMAGMVKEPVNTFTVAYNKKYAVSEEDFAAMVATQYKTSHHVFRLEPEDFFLSLEHLVKYSEEPIVEPAAIALYHMSKLARQKAIVLLSGEGSDEILGGYGLYSFMRRIESIAPFVPACLLRLLIGSDLKLKHKKHLEWISQSLEKRYRGTSGYLTDSLKQYIYSEGYYESRGDYLEETFERFFGKVQTRKDILDKMLYVDTKTWLVDDLLIKADKMTMAASIELRVPFLDHRLVEFAFSLPSSFKLLGRQSKRILKDVMRDRLPGEIIDREKKGFPVPTKQWFGGELLEEIRSTLVNADLPWINPLALNRVLKDQQAGKEDHSKILMSLLVLNSWKKSYLS